MKEIRPHIFHVTRCCAIQFRMKSHNVIFSLLLHIFLLHSYHTTAAKNNHEAYLEREYAAYSTTEEISFTPFQLNERKLYCIRNAPQSLSHRTRETLCGDGTFGIQPAQCANGVNSVVSEYNIHLSPNLVPIVIEFCTKSDFLQQQGGGYSSVNLKSSGSCLGVLLASNLEISHSLAFGICNGATSINPALCATELILPKGYPFSFRHELCGINKGTLEKAMCVNHIFHNIPEKHFTVDDLLILCHNTASGPIISKCASHHHLKSISTTVITELCRNSLHSDPVVCFREAPFSSPLLNARLCSGSSSIAPASCAIHILSSSYRKQFKKMTDDDIIELCRDATLLDGQNGTLPAKCLKNIMSQSTKSLQTAISLCKASKTEHPATCYKKSKQLLQNETLALIACEGTSSSMDVVSCLLEAPYSFSENEKANLCHGAKKSIPGICATIVIEKCFQHHHTCGNLESSVVIDLCKETSDLGSASCFWNAPKGLTAMQRQEICRNVEFNNSLFQDICWGFQNMSCSEKQRARDQVKTIDDLPIVHQPSFFECITKGMDGGLSSDLVINLCSNDKSSISYNNVSIKCALEVPVTWPSRAILLLCKDAIDSAPRDCAVGDAASQLSLTPMLRAILCHGISYQKDKSVTLYSDHHEAPIKCMQLTQIIFGMEESLSICAGSQNLTPAYCALSLPSTYTPLERDRCREVVSRVEDLTLIQLMENNESISPQEIFQVKLLVKDQFGQHRIWDNHTIVTAILSSHRDKEENPRYYMETSVSGNVVFQNLSIEEIGTHDVKFCVTDVKYNLGDKNRLRDCTRVKVHISSPRNSSA